MTASKQHLPCDASFFSGDHSFAAFWLPPLHAGQHFWQ
jgi:hypothetical protein